MVESRMKEKPESVFLYLAVQNSGSFDYILPTLLIMFALLSYT